MGGARELPAGIKVLAGLALAAVALTAVAALGSPRRWLGLTPDPSEYVAEEISAPCRPRPDGERAPRDPRPPAGSWRREDDTRAVRDELMGVTAGERIYLLGGHEFDPSADPTLRSSDRVHSFDPRSGRYRSEPALPVALDHPSGAAIGGEIYVAGGDADRRAVRDLWRFSPASRSWQRLAPMRRARAAAGAAAIGDRLYVAGGAPPTFPRPLVEPFPTLEIYDTGSGRWSSGPDMGVARHHVGAAALDGMLYVVGGREPEDFSLAVVERFDPVRGGWERMPDLPQGVGGAVVAAVAGKLVVAGGGDDQEGWVTPAAWAFDPDRNAWERLPDLGVPRHGAAAAAAGNRLYVFGGSPCAGYGSTRAVESLAVR